METRQSALRAVAAKAALVVALIAIGGYLGFRLVLLNLGMFMDAAIGDPFPERWRESVPNPGAEFTQITGFAWPASARVLSVGDSHGGFHGDGEFHLIFEADRSVLDQWLNQPPPWSNPSWSEGPVPTDIATHCFLERDFEHAAKYGVQPYPADPRQLLQSSSTHYAASERGSEHIRWHNGYLLLIESDRNRVWLSCWDL